MIRKKILLVLLSLLSGAATSCIDSDSKNDDDIFIIEPPDIPMFQFDEQGIPYRWETPTLSSEMQNNYLKETIGYGWKWMQTFEILENGRVNSVDFYESTYGKNPTSYYFKSHNQLTKYFYSDTVNERAYLSRGFTTDLTAGILSDGNKPTGILPWTFFLRIWSIYQMNGRWYMSTIEPLGFRTDENQTEKIIWGYSHYCRMSNEELKQMQREYNFDYSLINAL